MRWLISVCSIGFLQYLLLLGTQQAFSAFIFVWQKDNVLRPYHCYSNLCNFRGVYLTMLPSETTQDPTRNYRLRGSRLPA